MNKLDQLIEDIQEGKTTVSNTDLVLKGLNALAMKRQTLS